MSIIIPTETDTPDRDIWHEGKPIIRKLPDGETDYDGDEDPSEEYEEPQL